MAAAATDSENRNHSMTECTSAFALLSLRDQHSSHPSHPDITPRRRNSSAPPSDQPILGTSPLASPESMPKASTRTDSSGERKRKRSINELVPDTVSLPTVDNITSRRRDVFPWFRLPAELRNRIYSLAGVRNLWSIHGPRLRLQGPRFQSSPLPATSLLLLNKQFRREYFEELELRADTLEYRPNFGSRLPSCDADQAPHASMWATSIKTLVLNLNDTHYHLSRAVAYDVADENITTAHRNTKDTFRKIIVNMPQLTHIKIRVHFEMDWLKTPRVNFVNGPILEALVNSYLAELGENSVFVETEFLFKTELYTPYQTKAARRSKVPVPCSKNNWMELRGVPSHNPNAYRGLKLEVVRCGRFTEKDWQKWEVQAAEACALRAQITHLKRRASHADWWRVVKYDSDTDESSPCMLSETPAVSAFRARAAHLRRCALHLNKNDSSDSDEDLL